MIKPTDTEILNGLKNNTESSYSILYTFYYPVVEKFILRNNGTKDDARDVFQDTILVLFDKVPKPDFNLTSSLKTYIFAISSNIWLKKLEKAKRSFQLAFESTEEKAYYQDFAFLVEEKEKLLHRKLDNWFGTITIKCQNFLKALFFLEKGIETLGYKNKHSAQNQQYKCLQQIRKAAIHTYEIDGI